MLTGDAMPVLADERREDGSCRCPSRPLRLPPRFHRPARTAPGDLAPLPARHGDPDDRPRDRRVGHDLRGHHSRRRNPRPTPASRDRHADRRRQLSDAWPPRQARPTPSRPRHRRAPTQRRPSHVGLIALLDPPARTGPRRSRRFILTASATALGLPRAGTTESSSRAADCATKVTPVPHRPLAHEARPAAAHRGGVLHDRSTHAPSAIPRRGHRLRGSRLLWDGNGRLHASPAHAWRVTSRRLDGSA
jgi:hypothetical protein